ncbi:hypothetical protein ACFSNO_16745 [Streptomyces cirratus]
MQTLSSTSTVVTSASCGTHTSASSRAVCSRSNVVPMRTEGVRHHRQAAAGAGGIGGGPVLLGHVDHGDGDAQRVPGRVVER